MSYYTTIRVPAVPNSEESVARLWHTYGIRARVGERIVAKQCGIVAWLTIQRATVHGMELYRFKALVNMSHERPVAVTHYASGRRIVGVKGERAALANDLIACGKAPNPTARAVAQLALDRLVYQHGAEVVIERLEGVNVHPQLNPR